MHRTICPTPRSALQSGGNMSREAADNIIKKGQEVTLAVIVSKDLPEGQTGQLNPDWVEWLMGWPICWSSLEPIDELLWLDWSVDPADLKAIQSKWDTPSVGDLNPRALGIKKLYDGPGQEHLQSQALRKQWPTPTINECFRYGHNQGGAKDKKFINDVPDIGPIPRITADTKNRVDRLKAIGNGQVSLCTATAWQILTNDLTERKNNGKTNKGQSRFIRGN